MSVTGEEHDGLETAQKDEGEARDRLRSRRHESKLRIDIK